MGNPFSSSQKVIALCDVCGFQYKLRELKNLFVKGRDTNVKACRECWSPVRNPRVDQSLGPAGDTSSRDIQWGWNPVGGGNDPFGLTPSTLLGTGVIGQVTVTTT